MKNASKMSLDEKMLCLEDMLTFIQSAVESEQQEPADFKLETEKRIHLVYTNLKEILGLPPDTP